jgi:hypothetical protein
MAFFVKDAREVCGCFAANLIAVRDLYLIALGDLDARHEVQETIERDEILGRDRIQLSRLGDMKLT